MEMSGKQNSLVNESSKSLVDYTDDEEDNVDSGRNVQGMVQIRVGPLTPKVGIEQLYEIFSTFGEVVDIELRQGTSRKVALVRYRRKEEARMAISGMDGGWIDLQEVVVSFYPVNLGDVNSNWQEKGPVLG